MAIPLDQIPVGIEGKRALVQAGVQNRSFLAYSATANANTTLQLKRIELCARVTREPEYKLDSFVWMVLTETTVTDVVSVDETTVKNVLNQGNWDMMADLLVTAADVASIPAAEAQGVVAVGAAITSVTSVAHNLGVAPTADKFWFAFAADPLASGFPWASAITSTTFTLNVKAAPGGAGTSVAWRIRL